MSYENELRLLYAIVLNALALASAYRFARRRLGGVGLRRALCALVPADTIAFGRDGFRPSSSAAAALCLTIFAGFDLHLIVSSLIIRSAP